MSVSMKRTAVSLILCGLILTAVSAGAEPVLVDQFLKGRVTKLEEDWIEVLYDFEDEAQLADWIAYKPYRAAGDLDLGVEGAGVRLKGTGAIHHVITFTGKVRLEFDLTPRSDRDMGAIVSEDAEGDQFVLYSLNDIYFQKFDGVKTPQHMVTRFGVRDTSDGPEDQAFRYVARGTEPKLQTHQPIRLVAEKDGKNDYFLIGDQEYKGKDPGREMTEFLAGMYVVKSSCLVDDVRVMGRVSPRWLEKTGVKLALSAPIVEEPVGPSPADQEAAEKLRRFRMGVLEGGDLIEVIAGATVSETLRQEAGQLLVEAGDKTLVPRLISLLYSLDLVTRQIGNEAVRGLTGKNFGYDPKGDEEKRSGAIQKLLKHIQKYPKEFGTGR